MMHFGIVSPPVSGHIHPLSALGRELVCRGHRVTYFQLPDLEDKIRQQGLEFHPFGARDFPRGSLPKWLAEIGQLKGLAAVRLTVRAVTRTSIAACNDLPLAVRQAGVDLLLVDQMEPAGGAVAEHLGLPFVTVCCALALNRDPLVPPPFTPWTYRTSPFARLRNRLGYAASDWMTRAVARAVSDYRAKWNLPPLVCPDDSFSRVAQICQMPKEFDYPRCNLPEAFHYVGPMRRPAPVPFCWDRLDGRPIIFASLGTLQNSREPVFRCFAEACQGLNAQLVIAHGSGLTDREAGTLPGAPVAVAYAPQLDLLARATLTITHAGLNTVLDSLAHGVPLVTVPITYEQPAISARVEWTGVGRSIPLARLDARCLAEVLREVLDQPTYRSNAQRMAEAIRAAGGVTRAADIVEASSHGTDR
jgi:zeaxanthin glucosyltransferase